MLSFHVKFVQTEGQTDNGKTIYPIFQWGGIKIGPAVPDEMIFKELLKKFHFIAIATRVFDKFKPNNNWKQCYGAFWQYFTKA